MTGLSLYVNDSLTGATTRPTFVDYLVLQQGYLYLKLRDTKFLTLPVAQIPSGGAELNYSSNITPAATEFHVNRGVSAISNRFYIEHGITIDEQESLTVELHVPGTIGALTDLTCVLWGSLTRPVN